MSGSKKQNNDFKFVNYLCPNDTQNGKTRKQVRSHVSRWQHSQARARLRDAAQSTMSDADTVEDSRKEPSCVPSDSVSPQLGNDTTANEWYLQTFAKGRTNQADYDTKADYSRQTIDEFVTEATPFLLEACQIASSSLERSFSQGTMSFRTIALHDSQNIVGVSLKQLQLELSSVMGLYKTICKAQAVDFARQYAIDGNQGLWGRFYSFVFTDPILLSTAVLLGARNQLDANGRLAACRPYLSDMTSGLTAHPQANTTIFRTTGSGASSQFAPRTVVHT